MEYEKEKQHQYLGDKLDYDEKDPIWPPLLDLLIFYQEW